jgi:hypothetical protein
VFRKHPADGQHHSIRRLPLDLAAHIGRGMRLEETDLQCLACEQCLADDFHGPIPVFLRAGGVQDRHGTENSGRLHQVWILHHAQNAASACARLGHCARRMPIVAKAGYGPGIPGNGRQPPMQDHFRLRL